MIDRTWLDESSNAEEAAALTARFVSLRSYPGEEGTVQRDVAVWLEENGLRPELWPTEGNRPNVVARVDNGPGPTFLFNGHTDTVLAAQGRSPELTYNAGVADTNYFAADLAIPTIQFGPLGANIHQRDEWVDVPSIGTTVRVLLRLALDVLQ